MSGHLGSFSLPNLSLFIVKVLAGEYRNSQGLSTAHGGLKLFSMHALAALPEAFLPPMAD
jgi:hypothetical protein